MRGATEIHCMPSPGHATISMSTDSFAEEEMNLLLATGNCHKVTEISAILRGHLGARFERVRILTIKDMPPHHAPEEKGDTFLDNALVKGRYYAGLGTTLTLADDSGLEVDALEGRPGIFSSRYAPSDKERISRLLEELEGVPHASRGARFVCTAVLVHPDGAWNSNVGYCHGWIAGEPRGDNGFGFDPVFFIPSRSMTMAELSMEEKNKISHRAVAISGLVPLLNKLIDLRGSENHNKTLKLFDHKSE